MTGQPKVFTFYIVTKKNFASQFKLGEERKRKKNIIISNLDNKLN
jgi:hypothetical protein